MGRDERGRKKKKVRSKKEEVTKIFSRRDLGLLSVERGASWVVEREEKYEYVMEKIIVQVS